MYHTCLHCTRDLGRNDIVETLPIGRRIAFDAAKGRLWVVCRSCGKWNLVPFDNRLEAIDDCARLFHDTKTRFSTDNIGLARMQDGLELVRIGEPERPEFASWRYGAQYKRRRRVNMAIGGGALVATTAASIALQSLLPVSSFFLDVTVKMGVVIGVTGFGMRLQDLRRRVLTTIPGAPGVMKVGLATSSTVHIATHDGTMTVSWADGALNAIRRQHVSVTGPEARLLVRKVLALINRNAGSANDIDAAVHRMEGGQVARWLAQLPGMAVPFNKSRIIDRQRLGGSQVVPWINPPRQPIRHPGYDPQSFLLASLPRSDRLAIEMWLSEEDEARALAGELALLERQWRDAEELAAIADGLSLGEGEG
jgi:hypothetical protein